MAGPIILAVENEPLILAGIESALADGGFEIVAVSSADLAMRYLQDCTVAPAALITDIKLSGDMLTGWDLAYRAREMWRSISVIYISGDSAADWKSKGVPESVFIQKPFAAAQMISAASAALNKGIRP